MKKRSWFTAALAALALVISLSLSPNSSSATALANAAHTALHAAHTAPVQVAGGGNVCCR